MESYTNMQRQDGRLTRWIALVGGWVMTGFLFGVWVGIFMVPTYGSRLKQRTQRVARSYDQSFGSFDRSLVQRVLQQEQQRQQMTTTHPPARVRPAPQPQVRDHKPASRGARGARCLPRPLRESQLPQVAFGRLSNAQQRRKALAWLNQMKMPCGCGQSVATCVQASAQCRPVRVALQHILDGVFRGTTKASVKERVAASVRASLPSDAPPVRRPLVPVYVPLKGTPIRGHKDAILTVVLFADFQSAASQAMLDALALLEARYGSHNLRVSFRHLPMSMHPDAWRAAEASVAAHTQGKFWAFHNALFAHQEALSKAALLRFARQLKLDLPRFRKELDGRNHYNTVAADVKLARRLGLRAAPVAFVNGIRATHRSLPKAAARAWQRAQALMRQGVPATTLYTTFFVKRAVQ